MENLVFENQDFYESFSNLIASKRKEFRMTQKEFSSLFDISPAMLSRLEIRTNPSVLVKTVEKIIKDLDIKIYVKERGKFYFNKFFRWEEFLNYLKKEYKAYDLFNNPKLHLRDISNFLSSKNLDAVFVSDLDMDNKPLLNGNNVKKNKFTKIEENETRILNTAAELLEDINRKFSKNFISRSIGMNRNSLEYLRIKQGFPNLRNFCRFLNLAGKDILLRKKGFSEVISTLDAWTVSDKISSILEELTLNEKYIMSNIREKIGIDEESFIYSVKNLSGKSKFYTVIRNLSIFDINMEIIDRIPERNNSAQTLKEKIEINNNNIMLTKEKSTERKELEVVDVGENVDNCDEVLKSISNSYQFMSKYLFEKIYVVRNLFYKLILGEHLSNEDLSERFDLDVDDVQYIMSNNYTSAGRLFFLIEKIAKKC